MPTPEERARVVIDQMHGGLREEAIVADAVRRAVEDSERCLLAALGVVFPSLREAKAWCEERYHIKCWYRVSHASNSVYAVPTDEQASPCPITTSTKTRTDR